MRVVALGQALIHDPVTWPDELRTLTEGADAVICNFEGCLPPEGAWPMKTKTVHAAHPQALGMLRDLGVTHLALANNHAWDYGHAGVIETRRRARNAGFSAAGTGINAAEAWTPAVAGGVAMIAVDAGPTPGWAVAHDGPGNAALRLRRVLELPADDIAHLTRIDKETGMADRHRRRAEIGFDRPGDWPGPFGLPLEQAPVPGERYEPDPADLVHVTDTIGAARKLADIVVVALHFHVWDPDWHQVPGWIDPLWTSLRAAGAQALIGTGPPWPLPARIEADTICAPGLGNLVFHTRRGARYDTLGLPVWQGRAAVFESGTWRLVNTEVPRRDAS